MKADEVAALPAKLSGDFRSIEPYLAALDKHLTLRTYLSGYSLSDVDAKVWVALADNRVSISFIRRGTLVNLKRWFVFVEESHPEIQAGIKAAKAAQHAKVAAASKAGGSYNLALKDASNGVVTRFLPEPSGYLHIGHAKAALLSDYFARQYNGTLKLRLDDTNPSKEKEEFQDAIIEDLRLMGIRPDTLSFTSDYFDYLYDMALKLIKEGGAYADDTDQETMRDERFKGIPSKRRERTVEETLRIFEEMKNATPEGVKNCIRAKISYDDNNKTLRDPVIYRVNLETAHHRTGNKWKMYPTYDFACPVIDSLEGITHAMRSTEYTDRNAQYQWFQKTLGLREVHMFDFARMNFIRTFLSKRKLAKLVDTGRVWGWDDPRMPTIRGVRRRGMTIPALRDFILKQGPSRSVTTMEWGAFWAGNKKEIDPVAPRYTVVTAKDAVKVSLIGADVPAEPFVAEKPLHPKNKDVGTKQVVFSSEILLDQGDLQLMKVGEEITLMAWGNAIVRSIEGGSNGSPITGAKFELHLAGDVKKTEKKVTWLSSKGQKLLAGEAWDFDYLLTKNTLEEDDNLEDCLTPVTATEEAVLASENMSGLKADDIIQLERRGFYRVDKGLGDWKEGEAGAKGPRIVLFAIPSSKA